LGFTPKQLPSGTAEPELGDPFGPSFREILQLTANGQGMLFWLLVGGTFLARHVD